MKRLVEEASPIPTTRCRDTLVTICGAGTLGGNLAEALAQRGFQRLRLIDRDWVEEQNLDTQPFLPRDIGTPKARTLARTLFHVAETQAEPLVVELTEDNAATLLAGSQLVIDAFDNADARRAVAMACANLDVPCLHLAADVEGKYGLLGWDEFKPETNGGSLEDYSLPMTAASMIVDAGCESVVRFVIAGEKCAGKVLLDAVAV